MILSFRTEVTAGDLLALYQGGVLTREEVRYILGFLPEDKTETAQDNRIPW